MQVSMVRLIAAKEFRDLVRDRRTLLLVLVLPAVIYPFFGLTGLLFASSLMSQPAILGVIGTENLPAPDATHPPFLVDGKPADFLAETGDEGTPIVVKAMNGDPDELLRTKQADAILVIPNDFRTSINDPSTKPSLLIRYREGDEKAKLAEKRLTSLVMSWQKKYREARFVAKGLPKDFDQVFVVKDQQSDQPKAKKAADELRDAFARVFPFVLMMWLVAGAMQPAVDMTAGEKERGTMETLLISPAERSEIVFGKFIATTIFSFASVVWNVVWITAGAILMEQMIEFPIINKMGVIACVVLGVPLAMFFSAICIALGIFARSTKEGQYYLMPLMLITMPLAFWSMMPGNELSPGTCWVPVTGAILLQQRMLSVVAEPVPWEYFVAVIGSLFVWVALALALAVRQFQRESVLFREAGPKKGRGLRRWFKQDS